MKTRKSLPISHSVQNSRNRPQAERGASDVTRAGIEHSNRRMKNLFSNPIRLVWLCAFLTIAGGILVERVSDAAGFVATSANADTKPAVPVLVELFTSEGCSSCPPADALLALLDEKQPIPGVHAIVLSEHVTYWNQDGWHDPFSSDAMTDRQKQYGDRFGLSDVYTPQAVVDGSAQVVGSNGRGLQAAIEHAASTAKQELSIQDAQWSGDAVHFSVRGGSADTKTAFTAALAEDSAQSSVKHGENAGRNLRHVAVVRVIQDLGKGANDGRALALKVPNGTPPGPMRLVVFQTDRHSGHVFAVVEKTITQ